MSCYCVSMRWVFSWWWSIWWIWSYGYSNRTKFAFGRRKGIFDRGGPVFLDLFLFLLKSFGLDKCLWLLWRSCYLGDFACMYNGPLKGKFSNVPSCCIRSSLTHLLLSPHTRQFYFRYGIEDVICLWKDLGWYFWLGCLFWYCWPDFMCWYCCLVVLWWYFWLDFCCCVDADLVYSDGGMYFQSYCWQWGQSLNGIDSF